MGQTRSNSKWVGPIFTGIGSLFALVGIYFIFDAYSFAGKARTTMGEVIHVETRISTDSDGHRSTTYQPTIRYISVDDRTHEAETHISSSEYDYAIGARVEILYDPAEPDEVRLNSFWSLWAFPIVFTVMGTLFAVIGLVVWINTAKGRAALPYGTVRRDRDLL